jgi:hypothetical protein
MFVFRRASVVSSRRTVAELLHALAAVLAEQGLPWYLFGAQAAIIWGSPRLSADADVTVALEPERVDPFIEAMRKHGFDLVFGDADFVARTRVLPFIHRRTRMPVDIVLAGSGLEQDFLERAISIDLEGTPIPVISPEDLIVTKILAGRPKDLEDVRSVTHERRASLDADRIRSVLGLLEQALTQSDLLPQFEKEWSEKSSRKLSRPKSSSRKSKK